MIFTWLKFLESIGQIPISNLEIYNKRMEIGWEDKLFFIKKINPDVIVDFGCADGAILARIHKANPSVKLIGYEPDDRELSIAKSHFGDDVFLSNNWNDIKQEVSKYNSPALLLSSVIHEVYSYGNTQTIGNFWKNQVFAGDFKWICIRDMLPSVKMIKHTNFGEEVKKVRDRIDPNLLESYEKIWGKIDDNYKTFIHFLLKYKYVENWDREVAENYFPLALEALYTKIPNDYRISYENSFLLPHFPDQLKEDFDIKAECTTHTKMIILNTGFNKKVEKIDETHYHVEDVEDVEDIFLEYVDKWNMKHGKYLSDPASQRLATSGFGQKFDVENYNLWYTIYESFSPKITRLYVDSDYYIELNIEAHTWKGEINKDDLISDIDKFINRIEKHGWKVTESRVCNRKNFLNRSNDISVSYNNQYRIYLYR